MVIIELIIMSFIHFQFVFQMAIDFKTSLPYSDFLLAYKITMFAIWGVGVDIPRLLIRYARSYPTINSIHTISMLICGLLTVMYVIARTSLYYTTDFSNGIYLQGVGLAEFVISWIIMVCVIIQFGLGFKVRYEMVSNKLNTNLFSIKAFHRWLGFVMTILGKVDVALFLFDLDDNLLLFRAVIFLFLGFIFIFILVEVVYRIQSSTFMLKFPLKHTSRFSKFHEEILENINRGTEQFSDYKELGIRYIIIDNSMYYIDENFIHPGGQYIFDIYNGQEVNYLFQGTHQLIPGFPRHYHTKYVLNYLEERLVGKLQVESLLLNHTSDSQQLVEWNITCVQQMEGDGYLVEFEVTEGFLRQNYCIQNFGKYLMVSCPSEQVIKTQKRPYSIIMSLSNYQTQILNRFKEAYKTYYSESGTHYVNNSENHQKQNKNSQLVLCIKQYQHGIFTRFLLNSWAGKRFSIMGPFGRGLRIKPGMKSFMIIVAAGTGIFPFIDLFQYLLHNTLLRLVKEKVGEDKTRKLNEEKVNYDELAGTRILFVGSFHSSQHFYLENIPKDLYHLNQKHDLQQFDMMLRYNNMEVQPNIRMIKDYFDAQFFRSLLQMKPDRFYYCGPSSIQHTIRKVQTESKLQNTFFYI